MMGHLRAISMLLSTHSSFPSPAERGSHPALPEGRPPLVKCINLTGASRLGFGSKFAKDWLQIIPPDIPSVKFMPVKEKVVFAKGSSAYSTKSPPQIFMGNQALVNVLLRDT